MAEENLGSASYEPHMGADSQSFDQKSPITVDVPKPIHDMDDSQLLGAPVDVAGASVVAGGGQVVDTGGENSPAVLDTGVVKRKRGRPPRGQPKPPPAKKNKEEEDVCFICFDGGSLVLCDRRGCPKAYHPACIKRDEAFFRSKAKWNCGWHICSICQKAAHHMCYTCTYSLCKGCIKNADYVCVRGDKGFCTICMRTIMLIENSAQGTDEMAQVDFDDKSSWEYLFKVYWVYLKGKLSLTLDELTQAKNPWKEAGTGACAGTSPGVPNGVSDLKSISNLKRITSGTVACEGPSPGIYNGVSDLKSISNIKSITAGIVACEGPSHGVHNGVSDPKSITSDTSVGDLEESESKRRKTDELLKLLHKETVRMENSVSEDGSLLLGCKEWATKELLEFVAHMKNGDTTALSQFDIQALMLEYINRNNLRDPRRKSQIICDLRLQNLFGKPRVGHFEMLKLLEFHFLIKEDSQKNIVNAVASQGEADWNSDNMLMMGKDKKRKTCRKGEERAPQTNLDEFAAIDVHNMNLIYLRRNLMENLTDDNEKFHGKVVGSIVRIRISGSDQKQDMYRLVQVVGTSKVDEPYRIGNRSADVMLEVLNLDKKETVSIDAISNQELSEDECRRLQQSIRCGLVKRFTVGEIQEKAVALQSVRLNDWLETEILRLNHLRDRASEKGRKKELRECVEKLQLLKTPEERQRRLSKIPEVHSDPKMNPDYVSEEESGEHHNKKQGEYMKQNYSPFSGKGGKSSSPQKRAESSHETGSRPWRSYSTTEQTRNISITTSSDIEEGSTKALGRVNMGKDASGSSSMGGQQNEIDCNGSSANDGDADKLWHYRDPNGKVQGPFTMVQLQKWSTTGYFPPDMQIWASREDDSLLLTDALKGQFYNHDVRSSENMTTTERVDNPIEGPLPSSTLSGTPYADSLHNKKGDEVERWNSGSNSGNYGNKSNSQGFSGQSSGQNWRPLPEDMCANNLNSNPSVASLTKSTDLTEVPNLHSPTPEASQGDLEGQVAENKQPVSSVVIVQDSNIVDLPSPTPNTRSEEEKVQEHVENKQSVPSKFLVQDSGPSWSSASSLVVGGTQLPEMADEWGRYSSTQVKPSVEEWDSGLVSVSSLKPPLEAVVDHQIATPTSNIDQIIHSSPSSQPVTNNMSWQAGVHEPIEFSTLAEESVSDLLAEVDAMESQNGLPSPTSKRNNCAADYFIHGSIEEEFSPTPDQGTRSDSFSSTDVQLPCQSATTDELCVGASHANVVFDSLNRSSGLQSSISPPDVGEIKSTETGIAQRTRSEHMVDNWAEVERETKSTYIQPSAPLTTRQDTIDVERETKSNAVVVLLKQDERLQLNAPPLTINPDLVDLNIAGIAEGEAKSSAVPVEEKEDCEYIQPTASLTMSLGLVDPKIGQSQRAGSEVINTAWNNSSTTTLDGSRAGEGMVQQSQTRAEVGAEEDGEYIQPLTLSLDLGDPHISRRSVGSEVAQGNVNTPTGRSSSQGIISNTGRGNANVNRNSVGSENQRRYGGERFNSPRERERAYQGEDSGFSRGRSSWSRQSYGGGTGGGHSRPSPKGHICKFYESGRCKKGASCNYLHP